MCHLQFCHQNPKAQKAVLGGLEILIAKEYPETLMSKTMAILKCLYDQDIVDENVMIEWGSKVCSYYLELFKSLFLSPFQMLL